jgi:uncharacterized protein
VACEFNPQKSESNKIKHGIDFVEAQALWKSKHVLLSARNALEKRYMVIGMIGSEYWSAIISYRGASIRIISVGNRRRLRSKPMKKAQPESTKARNLEEKFDRGEDVLDYFDLPNAHVVRPTVKTTPVKERPSANRRTVVRERAAHYRAKKK